MKTIFKYLRVLFIDFLPVLFVILIAAFLKHDIGAAIYLELLVSGNLIWMTCIWMGNMNFGLYTKIKQNTPSLNKINWSLAIIAAALFGIIKTITYLKQPINSILLIVVSCGFFAVALIVYCVYLWIIYWEEKNAENI